jgi:hypothetical protein
MDSQSSHDTNLRSFVQAEVKRQIGTQVLSVCENQDLIRHNNWINLLVAIVILLSFAFLYYIWKDDDPKFQFWMKIIISGAYIIIAYLLLSKFILNNNTKVHSSRE